jgi:hypothetical protein
MEAHYNTKAMRIRALASILKGVNVLLSVGGLQQHFQVQAFY